MVREFIYWWEPYPDLKIGFAAFSTAANLTEASRGVLNPQHE
jgi:hypothetical protein